MSMLKEFKEFAMRGNVMDMAIGIIIGTAFGKIISSFVSDVLMPLIGLLLGGIDFSNLAIVLKESVNENTPAVLLKYGLFINTIIDFLIIAFAIFLVIKSLNAMKKKEEEAPSEPPKPSEEVELLRQIRDSLKK